MSNVEAALRQGTFESLKASALDLLADSRIVTSLGDKAAELSDRISTSYHVGIEDNRIIVPDDQKDRDNVGILCLFEHERGRIFDGSSFHGDLPPSQAILGLLPLSYGENISRYFAHKAQSIRLKGTAAALHAMQVQPVSSEAGQASIQSRSLILLGALPLCDEISKVATKVHEIDHNVFTRRLGNESPELFFQFNEKVRRSLLERSGYGVQYDVLYAVGALKGLPSAEDLVPDFVEEKIDSKKYQELAEKLTPTQFDNMSAVIVRAIHISLGSPDCLPEKDEIRRHFRYGLIH